MRLLAVHTCTLLVLLNMIFFVFFAFFCFYEWLAVRFIDGKHVVWIFLVKDYWRRVQVRFFRFESFFLFKRFLSISKIDRKVPEE